MKRFRTLPVVIGLVLAAVATGCTTVRELDGEAYERTSVSSNRVYVDDPYRGTIILERDPFTGRYYEVSRYGRYHGYDPYYRHYPRGYGRRIIRSPRQTTPPAQQPDRDRTKEKIRQEARDRVLKGS